MCVTLHLRATTDLGEPLAGVPVIEYPSPAHFTPEQPACTCWMKNADGDGQTLRHHFADTALLAMLKAVSYGNIVIEVR